MEQMMKTCIAITLKCHFLLFIVSLILLPSTFAQVPHLLSYQGRLVDGTNLVNGNVGLSLRLFDAASAGTKLYEDSNTVAVVDGLYATHLGDDTTAGSLDVALAATNVWLEVAVDDVALTPRERIASVAYALVADTAASVTGPVSDSQLSANIARLDGTNQTFTGPVTFSSTSNQFTGNFSGDGSEVTGVDIVHVEGRGVLTVTTNRPTFETIESVFTGTLVSDFRLTDVNGDGWVDIVTALENVSEIRIYTNNGNGLFTFSPPALSLAYASFVAALPINLDGFPDLVVSRPGGAEGSYISVYTNNGSGMFSESQVFDSLEATPGVLVEMDLNSDGWMDVIGRNESSPSSIYALTNNGAGQLVLTNISLSVPGSDYSMKAADIQGDNHTDLLLVGATLNQLWIYTNNGAGLLFLSATNLVGTGPVDLTVADVNGDAHPDVISVNNLAASLSVLTNNGVGVFTLSASPTVDAFPVNVASADLSGNGATDLISVNFQGVVTILTNNGSGSFSAHAEYSIPSAPTRMEAADVNNDGKADLVAAAGSSSVSLLINQDGFSGWFAGSFSGNGAEVTNLSAANITGGVLADARLSTNIARLSGPAQAFTGPVSLDNALNSFAGNGAGITNLSASALSSGTLADARLSANVALLNASQTFSQPVQFSSASGSFSGNGMGFTNLPASVLVGKVDDGRLSTNVAVLIGAQTFSGTKTFDQANGTFSGNGAGLTNLSATALAGGTLADARLSTNVALLNTGTYPDARLSTNIARLNATQTFSARQNVVTAPGTRAVEVLGDRTGNFNNSVVYLENTNRASSAPTLRVVGWGTNTTDDAVLNVSANGAGRIARFGNSTDWVVVIDNAGNVGGLTFTPSSDRNVKENFSPVDAAEILEKVAALPISRWNYQADSATPHIGPMAQDFHAAFGVGPDNTRIATVDADGVALAAIQALNAKLERENQALEEKVSGFSVQVSELEGANKVLREELEAIKSKLGM
jgi:hypothetical protein